MPLNIFAGPPPHHTAEHALAPLHTWLSTVQVPAIMLRVSSRAIGIKVLSVEQGTVHIHKKGAGGCYVAINKFATWICGL